MERTFSDNVTANKLIMSSQQRLFVKLDALCPHLLWPSLIWVEIVDQKSLQSKNP